MATYFPCPYLKTQVELTDERERHIAERHPDLLPEHRQRDGRHWIITAYIARKLVEGEIEWKRD